MKLQIVFATLEWEGFRDCIKSVMEMATTDPASQIVFGRPIIDAYNSGYAMKMGDIIGFIHDDVMIYEKGWDERVLKEFEDPAVGLVGFAGGLGHGHPQMYQIPYELPQLARREFRSNMRSAELHGARFNGNCDVSVLDGLALFVRRDIMKKIGGWPTHGKIGYYMYSEWLCCMMRRLEYKIRLVGVDFEHLGGKSSGLKQDQVFNFQGEHEFIYNEFRDVFPHHV